MKIKLIIAILSFATSFTANSQIKKWTLIECVEYALENNISIQQSELDLENAKINKLDAIGNFVPTLNARASYNASTGLATDPTTNQLVNQTFNSVSPSISSGLTLFDGMRNFNQLTRAKLTAIASQYRLDDMKDDVSLFVANAYLQVVFNRESLLSQQAQFESTRQDLERTKELVDSGVIPRGDLLEIEATAATQQQGIVNAENALMFSKISLAQLLQITDYENFDISDDDYMIPPSTIMNNTPRSIFAKALTFRNDIKLSSHNVTILEKDLEIAKGAQYPTLSAFFNYNTRYSDNVDFDFTKQLWFFDGISYGLSLNVPILNGFTTKNNIKRSKISLDKGRLQFEQDKLDLEATVNQAYNDAKGASKAYEAAEKSLAARKVAFQYSEERFNVGLLNSFDFNQTKQRLVQAETDVIRAKYDYIFRIKVLEFYFGLPISNIN